MSKILFYFILIIFPLTKCHLFVKLFYKFAYKIDMLIKVSFSSIICVRNLLYNVSQACAFCLYEHNALKFYFCATWPRWKKLPSCSYSSPIIYLWDAILRSKLVPLYIYSVFQSFHISMYLQNIRMILKFYISLFIII